MKKTILILSACITIMFISLAFKITADFLQTLEITRGDAENSVYYSFSGGYFNFPYSEVYHSISASTHAALVKEIGAFAKAYTRSESFKKKYLEERNSIKPNPPEAPRSVVDMKAEYKESLQESITNAESSLNNFAGDMRKSMEEMINTLKEQLKQADNPNNPMFSKETDAMLKQNYEQQLKDYETSVKEWEESYPESTEWMIKDRLNYFLEISATVDFSAKLKKSEYDQMIFVNPDYEEMPTDWKLIYRAGKTGTDAAREVAKQWLAELK